MDSSKCSNPKHRFGGNAKDYECDQPNIDKCQVTHHCTQQESEGQKVGFHVGPLSGEISLEYNYITPKECGQIMGWSPHLGSRSASHLY